MRLLRVELDGLRVSGNCLFPLLQACLVIGPSDPKLRIRSARQLGRALLVYFEEASQGGLGLVRGLDGQVRVGDLTMRSRQIVPVFAPVGRLVDQLRKCCCGLFQGQYCFLGTSGPSQVEAVKARGVAELPAISVRPAIGGRVSRRALIKEFINALYRSVGVIEQSER